MYWKNGIGFIFQAIYQNEMFMRGEKEWMRHISSSDIVTDLQKRQQSDHTDQYNEVFVHCLFSTVHSIGSIYRLLAFHNPVYTAPFPR